MGRKLLLKDVTERAKEMGFEFLDDVYINSTHKHTFRCLKHESVCNVPFNSIDRGQGFKCCKDAALRSQFKLSDDIVRERFSNLGFTLLGEYINSQTPIDIKCFCGKIFKDTPMLIWQQDVKSCGCVSYPTGKKQWQLEGISRNRKLVFQIFEERCSKKRNGVFDYHGIYVGIIY